MLSDRTLYSLQLLHVIHSQTEAKPRTVDELADETNIPRSFLAKIVGQLTRKGYLDTRPGPGGGVKPKMDADQLKLEQFFRDMGELTSSKRTRQKQTQKRTIEEYFSLEFSDNVLRDKTLDDFIRDFKGKTPS